MRAPARAPMRTPMWTPTSAGLLGAPTGVVRSPRTSMDSSGRKRAGSHRLVTPACLSRAPTRSLVGFHAGSHGDYVGLRAPRTPTGYSRTGRALTLGLVTPPTRAATGGAGMAFVTCTRSYAKARPACCTHSLCTLSRFRQNVECTRFSISSC